MDLSTNQPSLDPTDSLLGFSLPKRLLIDKIALVLFLSVCFGGFCVNVYSLLKSAKLLLDWYVFFTAVAFYLVALVLYYVARLYDRLSLVGLFFILSISLRVLIILGSPFTNRFVDLSMDQDMGQLLVNGINPYDFNDNVAMREQFRTDQRAYTPFTASEQQMWNYHAGSQLPLVELMMGWAESLSAGPYSYRLIFAWFDSLLCVYVLLTLLYLWQPTPKKLGISRYVSPPILLYALGISVIAPIFLRSGTLVGSFKGSMTLFTLAAIFFSYSKDRSKQIYLSAFFLGFATSFMAISILAVPLILWNIYQSQRSLIANVPILISYAAVALFSCLFWFLPFYDTLLPMIQNRVQAGVTVPIHGSMWRFLFTLTPEYWKTIQIIFSTAFVIINIIGFIRKKLSIEAITASTFIFFLHVVTTDGSMDRINISLMLSILLWGIFHQNVYHTLTPLYIFGGGVIVALSLGVGLLEKSLKTELIEYSFFDSIFNTTFFLVYTFLITRLSFSQQTIS
ncbi:hypothetical protein P1X15_15235 [Runella sp. MFBS21]|uniref:hypothetical protein n=1 Tax=Runella sp. MFBS21 TaxID=3034018 RepID=UPI0023F686E4|nr:hypothetical protein [Runella sp. MFBS21]MDF7818969.1 hypothetical protein [Runella sp. MFBS21]